MAGNPGFGGMTNTNAVLKSTAPKKAAGVPKRGKMAKAPKAKVAKPRGTPAARNQLKNNTRMQRKIDRSAMY